MKKILLFALFVYGTSVLSQNYQNICSPGNTFFKDPDGNLQAFRLDSLALPGNNDTVFLSYYAIHDTTGGYCLDVSNGSVLGRRVYKDHTGWFYFFNYRKDTIRINTTAGLNASWHFTKLPGNGYIEATLTGITFENVLGVNDSVKNFTLQAKDASGNPVDHPMNLLKVKLSKHYGLLRTPDLYYTPFNSGFQSDTIIFALAGKSTPHIGLQEATWKDIYDFEIGDIFHYRGMKMAGVYTHDWKKISTVISKIAYGNDSVSYTFEICTDTLFISSGNHSGIFDTITQTVKFDDFFETNFINAMPGELITEGDSSSLFLSSLYYRRVSVYSWPVQRQMKGRYGNYAGNYQDCWGQLVGWDNIYDFIEGLGQAYFFDGNMGFYQEESLCYFKKGTESWGAPVSTSCVTLAVNPVPSPQENMEIEVIPNPVVTSATVIISGMTGIQGSSVSLINSMGKVVSRNVMSANTYRLNRDNYPDGIYFLVICDKSGTKFLSKKIILN
jgi:hypothetical protein